MPDELGMKMAKGRVVKVRDRYVLVTGRRRLEIPVGIVASAGELAKLEGKEVDVVHSMTKPAAVVAIGRWIEAERRLRVPIICYIPPPDVLRRIGPEVRLTVIRAMVDKKVISDEFGRMLSAQF